MLTINALKDLHLAAASLAGLIAGGAIACVAIVLMLSPTLITQVPDPNNDSAFIAATPPQMLWNAFGIALYGAVIGPIFGGPAFALAYLPLHGWLMSKRRVGLLTYTLSGCALAALAVPIIQGLVASLSGSHARWETLFMFAPWFALAGGITTTVFWLIRRPDRIEITAT